MGIKIPLVGKRFGRLVVIKEYPRTRPRRFPCLCRCDCGVVCRVMGAELRIGDTKSCGCLRREVTGRRFTTHGEAGKIPSNRTPEYRAWQEMKRRCYLTTNKRYGDWGGRGIRVCDEWLNNFPAFLAHVGRRPSKTHSLDRIENDGHYEPGNVRWATLEEQRRNRRSTAR